MWLWWEGGGGMLLQWGFEVTRGRDGGGGGRGGGGGECVGGGRGAEGCGVTSGGGFEVTCGGGGGGGGGVGVGVGESTTAPNTTRITEPPSGKNPHGGKKILNLYRHTAAKRS